MTDPSEQPPAHEYWPTGDGQPDPNLVTSPEDPAYIADKADPYPHDLWEPADYGPEPTG